MNSLFTFEELVEELNQVYKEMDLHGDYGFVYIRFNQRQEYMKVCVDEVTFERCAGIRRIQTSRTYSFEGISLEAALEVIHGYTQAFFKEVEERAHSRVYFSDGEYRAVLQKVKECKESVEEMHLLAWSL